MSTHVLIDTSCWIEFFNRPDTRHAESVRGLVSEDLASITGVVLSELLQGTRTEREFGDLGSALTAATWIEAGREVYARAGELGFRLRRRGVAVPVTDCVIAAAAESAGAGILTLDDHFVQLAREADVEIRES